MDHEDFDWLLGELRPKLHRYCARMTGSVVDGDALLNAFKARAKVAAVANFEAWLFRIAHNAAAGLPAQARSLPGSSIAGKLDWSTGGQPCSCSIVTIRRDGRPTLWRLTLRRKPSPGFVTSLRYALDGADLRVL
jgi:hypothetical protein